MNYFEYNESRTRKTPVKPTPVGEVLEFTGDETIDVVEHGMTVADVREFIRNMHAHAEAERVKTNGNVVTLRKQTAA
ncbi:MAG: hypothetical protein AAGL69_17480 [Pseudomonadota bacterium]